MLSVGTKLLARIAANRAQTWAEPWVHEAQCGFRKGRGVDEVLQATRRIAEEVSRAEGSDWVLMSFFDIEKAYPRVCKDGMWRVVQKRGCPNAMIKVLKALHESTAYMVPRRYVIQMVPRKRTTGRMPIVTCAI